MAALIGLLAIIMTLALLGMLANTVGVDSRHHDSQSNW